MDTNVHHGQVNPPPPPFQPTTKESEYFNNHIYFKMAACRITEQVRYCLEIKIIQKDSESLSLN